MILTVAGVLVRHCADAPPEGTASRDKAEGGGRSAFVGVVGLLLVHVMVGTSQGVIERFEGLP